MYNAVKTTLLALAATCLLASCSGNKRAGEAQSLVETARAQMQRHAADSALATLDTLDHRYRDCLAERRQGTIVRLEALQAMTRDSLAVASMQLQAAQAVIDSLLPDFKQISVPGTDGYLVDKAAYTGREMQSTGLQTRIDDEGYLFVVVNLAGRAIGLDGVTLEGATAHGRSLRVEGSEIMTLRQEQAMTLVEEMARLGRAGAKTATATLTGSKGNVKAALNAKQLASADESLRLALALQQNRRLRITLEKLERQLARLADQASLQQYGSDEPTQD